MTRGGQKRSFNQQLSPSLSSDNEKGEESPYLTYQSRFSQSNKPVPAKKPLAVIKPAPTASQAKKPSPAKKPAPRVSPSKEPAPMASHTKKPAPIVSPAKEPAPRSSRITPASNDPQKPAPIVSPVKESAPIVSPVKEPAPMASHTKKPAPIASPSKEPAPIVSPAKKSAPRSSRITPASNDHHKPIKRRNLVFREIKRLQKSYKLLLPSLPFSRLVKQILWAWTDPISYRMTVGAIYALRTAFECYINIIMKDCSIMAAHGKRKTITARDIAFHQYIKPFYLPRY
ncbi:hypothetical protein ACTFIW_003215 [Dictyostelium discoideum]